MTKIQKRSSHWFRIQDSPALRWKIDANCSPGPSILRCELTRKWVTLTLSLSDVRLKVTHGVRRVLGHINKPLESLDSLEVNFLFALLILTLDHDYNMLLPLHHWQFSVHPLSFQGVSSFVPKVCKSELTSKSVILMDFQKSEVPWNLNSQPKASQKAPALTLQTSPKQISAKDSLQL